MTVVIKTINNKKLNTNYSTTTTTTTKIDIIREKKRTTTILISIYIFTKLVVGLKSYITYYCVQVKHM